MARTARCPDRTVIRCPEGAGEQAAKTAKAIPKLTESYETIAASIDSAMQAIIKNKEAVDQRLQQQDEQMDEVINKIAAVEEKLKAMSTSPAPPIVEERDLKSQRTTFGKGG